VLQAIEADWQLNMAAGTETSIYIFFWIDFVNMKWICHDKHNSDVTYHTNLLDISLCLITVIISSSYNTCQGLNTKLTANFNGFNTTLYKRRGCGSSTCEGVEILKSLHVSQSFLDSNVHSH
jgi:hypothetical protein